MNWVQFKWRNHDPQIGRFVEIDPLSEKYSYNSTYAFSENKTISHIELEGLEAVYPQNSSGSKSSIELVSEEKVSEINVSCGSLGCNTYKSEGKKFTISHRFNGQTTTIIWNQLSQPGNLQAWGIANPFRASLARRISQAIPGRQGITNSVLNSFSNFINNKLGIEDAEQRSFTMTDGYGKAFRHLTWQAVLTKVFGKKFSEGLGNAFEYDNLLGSDQNRKEMSYRDLINNEYGRILGSSFEGKLNDINNLVELLNKVSEQIISSFPELANLIPSTERKFFTTSTPGVQNLYNVINYRNTNTKPSKSERKK